MTFQENISSICFKQYIRNILAVYTVALDHRNSWWKISMLFLSDACSRWKNWRDQTESYSIYCRKRFWWGSKVICFLKFTLKQLQKIEIFIKKVWLFEDSFRQLIVVLEDTCLFLNKYRRFSLFCFSCQLFDNIQVMIYFIINLVVHLRKRWGLNVQILRR